MKNSDTVILGAGLAGISLAYFLKSKGLIIFEKETKAGGLCRSQEVGEFIFDYDGHLLHSRSKFFESLIQRMLKGRLIQHRRRAFVYFQNQLIPYPFQFSYKAVKKSPRKPLRTKRTAPGAIDNFSQWCYSIFGREAFSKFFYPYNKKFWREPLDRLDYKWAERFIPQKDKRPFGYNWQFFYPREGMQDLIRAFLKKIDAQFNLGFEATEIDIKRRRVKFANGFITHYRRLFISLPLIELGRIVKTLPPELKKDLGKLKFTSIYVLNLGVKKNLSKFGHWIYFPQSNISFFRVGFPSNFSPKVAPKNRSSLYAEISLTSTSVVDKGILEKKIISDLTRLGIIERKDIMEKMGIFIKYAYPMPLLGKDDIVERAESFLNNYDIYLIGRYGRWQYYSMEDVVLNCKKLLKRQ